MFLTREYLAIAMEFAAGGDMFQYVKQRGGLEEVEARWFFQQLIIGMDYCHKMARGLSSAWGGTYKKIAFRLTEQVSAGLPAYTGREPWECQSLSEGRPLSEPWPCPSVVGGLRWGLSGDFPKALAWLMSGGGPSGICARARRRGR